jgi:D-alanyl-lipoteichoic acid acyltransferase DltB (MBOAT superfamily)
MTFNSFSFWLVFPLIFGLYWLIPAKWNQWRKVFLIVVSYLLYMNWKPTFALVLLAITLVTYGGWYLVDNQLIDNKEIRVKRRKRLIWLFAVLSLLPLLVFKYYNFVNESVWLLLSSLGLRYELHGLNWAIPVGISFFTFQAVGYLFDVYYQRINAEKSIVDYTMFVCFFPQIFSGPISKANELLPQIKEEHKFNYQQGVQGLKFLLWGMFLKLVLADRLGLYVDKVAANYDMYNGGTCVLSAFFYSLQIYGDFAGYSLMAIGVAKTLGFNLINNFNRPYFSVSITDFWRRWHISLSRWLKDYVYIPMGGSRCSKLRNYWNIFVTFLVSGIWHGANWTFIVWGLIHGFAQIIEKAFGWNNKESKGFVKLLRIVGTFLLVTVAWVFFRMPTLSDSVMFIKHGVADFGSPEVLSNTNFAIYLMAIVLVLFKETREEFFPTKLRFLNNRYVRWAEYVVVFSLILLCGALDSGSFIYGSF